MKPAMQRRYFLPMALVIVTLAATGIVFFHGAPSGQSETGPNGKQKPPPQVRVITTAASKISEALELTGSVEAYRVARLGSPAEGPIVDVRVREADPVAADEPLLVIGRKKGVDALIVSLRETFKKERDNLRRTRRLVESNALSDEQLDQARAAYEKARAELAQAEEKAQDYIIKAPWAGIVSRMNVKEGEFVGPRSALVEIHDPDSLVIRAAAPEKYAVRVTAGMRVKARLDAYPGDVIPGRVERVYPYLDPRLRTRTLEIVLDNPVKLLPGMFARLEVLLETEENAVAIPVDALVNKPKGQMVFVVEDGKAAAEMVKTGIEAGNRIQIVSGIQSGDKVIVAGNEKLKDGADVRIAEDEKPGKGKTGGKAGDGQ